MISIAETLVSPVNKLIDAVAGACGTLYEPTQIKRLAQARAEEINIMSAAIRGNSDLNVSYKEGGVNIELTERALRRLGHQEILKQQNIDNVVGMACENLEGSDKVANTPVDKTWMFRFMDYAGYVSEEKIQQVWANVLSSEVQKPGSYSLRTLDILSRLSKDEAELFENLSKSVQITHEYAFIVADKIDKQDNISILEVTKLSDAGLMMNEQLMCTFSIPSKSHNMLFYNNKYISYIYNHNDDAKKIVYHFYKLTKAGRELYQVLNIKPDLGHLNKFLNSIADKHNRILFSVYEIEEKNGDTITHNKKNHFIRTFTINIPSNVFSGKNGNEEHIIEDREQIQ